MRYVCFLLAASLCEAQSTPSLRGQVTDQSLASVPGAMVIAKSGRREARQSTNEQGLYEFKSLTPGKYSVRVLKPGFAPYQAEEIAVQAGVSFDIQLSLASEQQTVTVQDEINAISTDPTQNAGALILKEEDLKSLSDDPDELAQELQALAGPGAGPNGGQIYIDGFTGGRIPPKSSIREVRVNQNPYSAEFDRIGFGRIEILTKPGTDKFRGDAFFGFSDQYLNSRNPFSPTRAPYESNMFGGRISGPLSKRASFGLDVEGRKVDENAVINATTLDSALLPVRTQQTVVTPQLRMHISPRVDYQINEKNTLVARYSYSPIHNDNRGVGELSLPSRAYDSRDTDQSIQISETAVLSPRAINETRFQYRRSNMTQYGDGTLPAIDVLDSFNGGGAQIGLTNQVQNNYEVQNLTTLSMGRHNLKFGGRVRTASLNDLSPSNFGGTFTFAGGVAPVLDALNQPVGSTEIITSLERYRRTLLFQNQGLTMAQIRALGGGPTQFTINGGNPLASISQTDVGLFVTEDWRVKPTLTLSAGLRWEDQTNISNHNNFAPRVGLAWAIDARGNRAAKTVLRLGAGMFYDRVQENLSLQALRFNGLNQVNYIVRDPGFYLTIPPLAELASARGVQTVRQLYSDIRTPYLAQMSVGIDRQLPRNTSLGVNYVFSRGVHTLRARNLNAPDASGVRPYGDVGNIYQYESSGFSRQNQLLTNFNTRFSKHVSLFGFYAFGYARSDTDGTGGFPANNNNLSTEYGPSMFDVRHRVVMGGSITGKWGVSLNPFLMGSSGAPFNITTGRDQNGDTLFNDRPAFATSATQAGAVQTPYGLFLLTPGVNDTIIPRNYGRGPAQVTLNMRLGKTWGFGTKGEAVAGMEGPPPGMREGGPGGRGPGGGGPPPGMGGGRGPGGPGGRGGPGGFGGGSTGKKYNLTLSLQARNVLNFVNLAPPNGNLSSPLFGQSTQLAGFFGPGGGGAAGNRRVEVQLRFSF